MTMKKTINIVSVFICLLLIACGTKPPKTPKTITTEYEIIEITKKEVLSDDGMKIVKVPVISLRSYGAEVQSKKQANRSAVENATAVFSNLIKKRFQDAFDEKASSLNTKSQEVLRTVISTTTDNVINNLKPGKIVTEQKPNGNYISLAEVSITGKEYKGILANAKSGLDAQTSQESKEFFDAVDDILDN